MWRAPRLGRLPLFCFFLFVRFFFHRPIAIIFLKDAVPIRTELVEDESAEKEEDCAMMDLDSETEDEDEDDKWPPAGFDAPTLRLRFQKAKSIFIQKARLAGIKVEGDPASPGRRSAPGEWKFAYDLAKRRCGVCRYTSREISLSLYYLGSASRKQVVDTILHELA